jgi:hypothetical protein
MGTDPLRQRRREHPFDCRAVDASLLERGAIVQHPAHSTTTPRPIPPILPKGPPTIQHREELGDLVVELFDP